jgi:uncharacterized membrane protein
MDIGSHLKRNFFTNRTCTRDGQSLCTVFIPTTPNPTSGYLLMVREKELQFLGLPVDRALRYIVSLGTSPTGMPWIENH